MPPKPPAYAKPASHAIYYGTTFPGATLSVLARYDSITLASTGVADPRPTKAAIDTLRSTNPAIKIFAYNIASEQTVASHDHGGTYGNVGAKLTSANWLLRNADNALYITYGAGDGTFLPDRGLWATETAYAVNDVVLEAGTYRKCTVAHTSASSFAADAAKWTTTLGVMAINCCDGVLPDHDGLSFAKYFARHVHYLATRGGATWDGAYLDAHGYTDENVRLDWENNGNNVAANVTASVKRKMERFYRELVAELANQFGTGFKILDNTNGGSLLTEYVTAQGMSAYADGWLHESTVAPSVNWSYLCVGGIGGAGNTVMGSGWAIKARQVRDPDTSFSVLGVKPSTTTDYATIRLGIALALMENARAAITPPAGYASASILWADEFDQPLGIGIDAVQSAAARGTVWRRRFQNGVVLINESKLAAGPDRGAWAPGMAYKPAQYVKHGGFVRVCKYGQEHTSSDSFAVDDAAGRWHTMTGTAPPNHIAGAPVTIDSSVVPYGIYTRFSGTQDRVHNSGATVNGSFALAGLDAIVLLCVTAGVHA